MAAGIQSRYGRLVLGSSVLCLALSVPNHLAAQQPDQNNRSQPVFLQLNREKSDPGAQSRSSVSQNLEDQRDQMASFRDFLASHPDIWRDLSERPGRIDNPAYVNQHRALKIFLENHPDVRTVVRQNPDEFRRGGDGDQDSNPQQ